MIKRLSQRRKLVIGGCIFAAVVLGVACTGITPAQAAGFEVTIQNTKYGQDEKGTPCQKVWHFEISMGVDKKPLYGILTAHGAGTVEEPLKRYDISAYVG